MPAGAEGGRSGSFGPCALILLLCLLLLACDAGQTPDPETAHLIARRADLESQFQRCERGSGSIAPALLAQARCLIVTLPENPAEPTGVQIQVKVMVLPSIKPVPASDAFTILVGGPGEAATESGLALAPLFNRMRRERDILLIDQRGTGSLGPFTCNAEAGQAIEALSPRELLDEQAARLRRCLRDLDARAEYYTTDIAVRDLEAIRLHLGYSSLNVWGGSYGSRTALAYLRAYPESVRTVVVDGVAPPGIFPLGSSPDEALDLVIGHCEASPVCAAAFPNLRPHLDQLLARLEVPEPIDAPDPRTGEPASSTQIDREGASNILFLALYNRELTRLLPLMIEAMYGGDYRSALALASAVESRISEGMYYSVVCNEDMARLAEGDPMVVDRAENDDSILASSFRTQALLEACALWPRRTLDPDFFEPVTSDKPVLILSGEQDPVTPPSQGAQVARTLSNSLHLIVSGVGHITTPYGCVSRLITDFVEAGEHAGLNVQCVEELSLRPFFLTTGGSAEPND